MAERNIVISVIPRDIAAKNAHHKGSCHQSGSLSGVKVDRMLENTRHGRAMSIASREIKLKTFSGMIPRRVIQKPDYADAQQHQHGLQNDRKDMHK